MNSNSFSKRLKLLRVENNYQQNEVAKLLNIGVSSISNYETGISSPDINKLIKLSKIFNVTTDYLLGISDTKNLNFSNKDALLTQEIKENNISIYDIEYLKKIKKDFNGTPENVNLFNQITKTLNLNVKDLMYFVFNNKGEK